MERNRCQVQAESLDEAGCGVGKADGLIVHAADLLPGEEAEVALEHQSPHRPEAWGRVLRRIGRASPDRVVPPCPGFGRCGGCVWQHLAYPAQLEAKRARVIAGLGELATGPRGVAVAPIVPSPDELGYRNKGKYVAAKDGGRLVLGAFAPRTHAVVDTIGCRVVAPVIDEVAAWVRGAALAAALEPYDETTRTGELRYVVIRANAAGDTLVALVVAPGAAPAHLEQVANAVARHPAVRSVVAWENARTDGAILPHDAQLVLALGPEHLSEHVSGVEVDVGAGEFLQVNRVQAQAMYDRVAALANAAPGVRAIDLYAGLGGITFALARAGASVHAVEIDPAAVRALTRAAARAGLADRVTATAGDAAAIKRERPDVLVVNPPRRGLGSARAAVAALGAPTIIYVSCGPDSLGKDLRVLVEAGWSIDTVEPFDLMPGTPQVETIVRLVR
ncbi:MAG TPA: 23S rRNA (uracil(1939)-C(5))-methyltransferase RlmD [Kofleriaceae bacterium]|nr:23S rRNA (uracil(1939)-C(5))-methyltransferase RlmD [Kofleriaceae bacterium]